MKLKQALMGTMAVAVLATVASVAPASAHPWHRYYEERVVIVRPRPVIYEDDVTVDRAFAVVRHFHGRRFVNEWNGHRWVTRVIYY